LIKKQAERNKLMQEEKEMKELIRREHTNIWWREIVPNSTE
jgi:hypothetical protein